jgi:hypothetical protein
LRLSLAVEEAAELPPDKFTPVETVTFGEQRSEGTITAPLDEIERYSEYAFIVTSQNGFTAAPDNFLPLELRGTGYSSPEFEHAPASNSPCWKYFDDTYPPKKKFGACD